VIEKGLKILEMLGSHITVSEDKTRDRIVLTAKRRFLIEGFAKVTIGDLCHSLRISKKTFYKFFDDKEDLVKAIMASNLKIFIPRFAEIMQSDDPPDVRFDKFIDFASREFPENISVAFLADLQALMPEFWDAIDQFRQHQVRRVLDVLKEGQKNGVFNPEIEPEVMSKFILLVVTQIINPKTLYEAELQIWDVTRMWRILIRDGIYSAEYRRKKEGVK
jgi:AcrR family transcriptional regulator